MFDLTSAMKGLVGGALIGGAAAMLLLLCGRIAGISGIYAGVLLPRRGDLAWRLSFVAGLLLGGLVLAWSRPGLLPTAALPVGSFAR